MILVSSFTLGTSTGRWSTRFNVCEPLVDKNKREKKKKRGIVWKVLIVGNGNPIPMTHYLPLLPQRRSRNPTMSLRFAISSSIFYFFSPPFVTCLNHLKRASDKFWMINGLIDSSKRNTRHIYLMCIGSIYMPDSIYDWVQNTNKQKWDRSNMRLWEDRKRQPIKSDVCMYARAQSHTHPKSHVCYSIQSCSS